MIQRLLNWVDERTDYRRLLLPIRHRTLPNGPRWEYSTAACLFWLLCIEAVTGFLLMASYSPSVTTAWASVHFIDDSSSGAFIRGIHHYTSHALIIMFAIHTLRVLLRAAFRKPHELVWVTGLFLIPLMILWAITGNPLAATIKGMAQIEVEGSIIGSTPVIGPFVQRILIGGDEPGHLTLTRLNFLHVSLMPLLVGGLLFVHISQVYRHGLSTLRTTGLSADAKPYWPYQSIRNVTALLVVLGVIGAITWWRGAPLDAPADPLLPHTPRPEWYLLFLFELRRYFTGNMEFVATLVMPLLTLMVLLSMPVLDRRCSPQLSQRLRLLIVVLGLGVWSGLTITSVVRDWYDVEYQASRASTATLSERAMVLADRGEIAPEGAIALLRNDPKTQGPLIFAQNCATCHSHTNAAGQGIVADKPCAPNLFGFGSREWIAGLLDPKQIAGEHYFGNTKFAKSDMVGAVADAFDAAETPEDKRELHSQMQQVAWALSAEAELDKQAEADDRDQTAIAAGRELVATLSCTDCHKYRDKGDLGSAPDLTGYASRDWLAGIIGNPNHERFYGDGLNDGMPAFAEDLQHPETNQLSPKQLDLLIDWLRGEWYEAGE